MALLDEFQDRYSNPPTDPAKKVLFAVISDLTGRGGFDGIWDDLDEDTRRRAELNPLRAFDCKNDHCREIMANLGGSVSYLPGQGGAVPDEGRITLTGGLATLPLREARELFEREYLNAQILRFGGNISRTANFIGMERSALHRKLKALGVG